MPMVYKDVKSEVLQLPAKEKFLIWSSKNMRFDFHKPLE